jgi:RNA polymerase sigma factor (TIGR02999 family)
LLKLPGQKGTAMDTQSHDVTQLLINWREGDEDVSARLVPLIYDELQRLIHDYFRREQSDQTRGATALVHETYFRMVDDKQTNWKDRAYFYGVAARVMRQILVDHARTHKAAKREGLEQKLSLDEGHDLPTNNKIDLVALDSALENFAQTYPRKLEVVELKFFGGLNVKEISELLQVSEKTVLRDWNFAKLWLCRALSENVA